MTIEEIQQLCIRSGLPHTTAAMLQRHARETGAITDESTELEQVKHYTQAISLLVEVIHESKRQQQKHNDWRSGRDKAVGSD